MESASVCCFIWTKLNTLFLLKIRRKQMKGQFTEKLVYSHSILALRLFFLTKLAKRESFLTRNFEELSFYDSLFVWFEYKIISITLRHQILMNHYVVFSRNNWTFQRRSGVPRWSHLRPGLWRLLWAHLPRRLCNDHFRKKQHMPSYRFE